MTRPGQLARAIRPGRISASGPNGVIHWRMTPSTAYCFGGAAGAAASAGAAGAAASAGAAGAAASAGAAGASAAGAGGVASVAAGGGVAAGSVLADSCFAQAVSISAATSALRASLVFIDRYPEEKQEW